jgi:hypothetical protein
VPMACGSSRRRSASAAKACRESEAREVMQDQTRGGAEILWACSHSGGRSRIAKPISPATVPRLVAMSVS